MIDANPNNLLWSGVRTVLTHQLTQRNNSKVPLNPELVWLLFILHGQTIGVEDFFLNFVGTIPSGWINLSSHGDFAWIFAPNPLARLIVRVGAPSRYLHRSSNSRWASERVLRRRRFFWRTKRAALAYWLANKQTNDNCWRNSSATSDRFSSGTRSSHKSAG